MPLNITFKNHSEDKYPFFNKAIEEVNLLFKNDGLLINKNIEVELTDKKESHYDIVENRIYIQQKHNIKSMSFQQDIEYTFAHELSHVVHDILIDQHKSITLNGSTPFSSFFDKVFPNKLSPEILGVKIMYNTVIEGFADSMAAFLLLKHQENGHDTINKFLKNRQDQEVSKDKVEGDLDYSSYITVPSVTRFLKNFNSSEHVGIESISKNIIENCLETLQYKSLPVIESLPKDNLNMSIGYVSAAFGVKKGIFSNESFQVNRKLRDNGCLVDFLEKDITINNSEISFSNGNSHYHLVEQFVQYKPSLIIKKGKRL